jgi:ubiquinone/menaquinone biosynthesis C-methylase UbiE
MQRIIFGPIQQAVLQLAAEQVSLPSAILDVGCGTGKLLKSAESRFPGAKLVGVDAAIEMVKYAQASNPIGTIQFQQAMAEELPFPNASFDLVFSTMTFHHWPDQTRGIAEVARVLSPGGRWLLADFVASGFMSPVRKLLTLHQFPERAALERMLSKAGLKVIAERRIRRLAGQIAVMAMGPTL